MTGPTRLDPTAVIPLDTLDPDAPLDDLSWLDDVVGDARVVAIGESAHYNAESYQLRHRILRHLVARHGFDAYAMETGFVEATRADAWIRGGDEPLGAVLAGGLTSLMGLWTPMGATLQWLRAHNTEASTPVAFHGIDLGGQNVSPLPALTAVDDHLSLADPTRPVDAALIDAVQWYAAESAFDIAAAMSAYGNLDQAQRDAVTAGLTELAARLDGWRLEHVERAGAEANVVARRAARIAVAIDANLRSMVRGDIGDVLAHRDAAMADTVAHLLDRHRRVVLAAHNGHIQRWPTTLDGAAPVSPLGLRLAERLGTNYRVIGVTNGTGRTLNTDPDFYAGALFTDLEPPRAGSLDALLDAATTGPAVVDLRRLGPADTAAVDAATEQHFGTYYAPTDARRAYDAVIHLPTVTAAEPDQDALAHSPAEVQRVFAAFTAAGGR